MLCDYGCGNIGIYKVTKNGKLCCKPHRNSCPNMIKKNKKGQQKAGFTWSKKERIRMSKQRTGKKNGMYGKQHTKKNKELNRQRLLNKTYEQLYGVEAAKRKKENYSKKMKGRKVWNKGLTGSDYYTIETLNKWKYSIQQIKNKYPTFAKIEEIRYEPGKEKEKIIQVRCKNHKCKNSKEQGGWFTPINYYILYRARSIELGYDNNYLYCSEKCKQECPLYGARVSTLIKLDQIRAGHLEDSWNTSQEYQEWRQYIFELDNNKCVYCGEKATAAHHILPQKTHPELSLDPENGIAVCKSCHYKYGHRDSWCTTGKLSTLVCERIIRIKNK